MTRRNVYLQNAMLLTASGLVLRMLGMGFRVVLSAYLGGEGMGLYQLILAVYMVFVSLATAGMNVAATRLAAQSLARGQGMAATLRGLCTAALAFGTVAMVAQALLAGRRPILFCTMPGRKPHCGCWRPAFLLWRCPGLCAAAFWRRAGSPPMLSPN